MLVLGSHLHGVAGIDSSDPATSTADSQQQQQHLRTHNGQPSCLTAAAVVAGCCKGAPPGRPSASRANSILLSYFIGATNDIYGGYRSALRSSTALAVSRGVSGLARRLIMVQLEQLQGIVKLPATLLPTPSKGAESAHVGCSTNVNPRPLCTAPRPPPPPLLVASCVAQAAVHHLAPLLTFLLLTLSPRTHCWPMGQQFSASKGWGDHPAFNFPRPHSTYASSCPPLHPRPPYFLLPAPASFLPLQA